MTERLRPTNYITDLGHISKKKRLGKLYYVKTDSTKP